MFLWLAALWLASISFLLGFMAADLWRDHQERKRRTPLPAMSRQAWEEEGGGWRNEGEDWRNQGDGAPGYTMPPGVWAGDVIYCAKCLAENRKRRERKEKMLEPAAIIRRRDSVVYCVRHEEAFYPNFARYISQFTVQPEPTD